MLNKCVFKLEKSLINGGRELQKWKQRGGGDEEKHKMAATLSSLVWSDDLFSIFSIENVNEDNYCVNTCHT